MEAIFIDKEKCTLCGLCYPICVRRIIEEGDEAAIITDSSLCILCGHCKAICPEDAPQLPSLDADEFEPVPQKADLPSAEQLMGFFRSRRSIRIFRNNPVEDEKLDSIIQAGRFAPTGGNRQPLRYVLIQTPEKLKSVRDMTIEYLVNQAEDIEKAVRRQEEDGVALPDKYINRSVFVTLWRNLAKFNKEGIDRLFYHAPAVFICHLNPLEASTPDVDPGLAAMQMVLMAEALGLGACFIGFLVFALEESHQIREAVEIPKNHKVSLAFALGYPDVSYPRLVSRNPARVTWL